MILRAAEAEVETCEKVSRPAPAGVRFTPRAPRPPMIVATPGGPVFVESKDYVCNCPPRSWACGC
jgi:hypothetical protein